MGSENGITADSKPEPNFSPVAIWWAVWGFAWTVVVVAGMVYLIRRRNTPILRVRSLALSLCAMTLLHLYWISCQYALMYGPLMPGDGQYWVMGTYLPCGLALFHGANSYFLHVAKLQRKYAKYSFLLDSNPDAKRKQGTGLIARFRRLDYTMKLVVLVGFGMVFQVFLTLLMWLISRKYHSSWGIPGTEVHGTEMEQKTEQGRGWEWWPGVFWQFVWSWVVAPVILWNARHIRDTQGWRVQTIGCAISGLPATPMWLIALYIPAMEVVNSVWIPPQWIALSIFFMDIFTVLLPCWEVFRHQTLRKETLDAIKQWEMRTKGAGSDTKSLGSTATMVDSMMSGWKSNSSDSAISDSSARESILNMSALEYVLERNPTPLQRFSALNDFSGENVAFLTSIAEWKATLPKAVREGVDASDDESKEAVREAFNRALYIYAEFVSARHATFPVNISSQVLKKLENVFETPACILYGADTGESNPITPFNNAAVASPTYSDFSESSVAAIMNRAQYMGEISRGFNASVFDEAEHSIKYLVLTNTWPKFVQRRRASTDSLETLQSSTEQV
ncbi:hypothetical protein BDW62DRAFT_191682 [Aspergillus aurantiobrunneus]